MVQRTHGLTEHESVPVETPEAMMLCSRDFGGWAASLHTDPQHVELRLSVRVTGGGRVDGASLVGLLEDAHVVVPAAEQPAVQARIRDLEAHPRAVDGALLFAATPAVDGVDAVVHWRVDLVGADDPSDASAVDVRRVVHWVNVHAGDVLFELERARPGIDGYDIHGAVVPARVPSAAPIAPGTGCRLDGDSCVAAVDGVVRLAGDTVSVLDHLEIAGDLDYHTGNIDCCGEVHVRGSVPGGFVIRAGKGLIVDGVIEGAEVHCGGDIRASGIAEGSRVHAHGSVEARYVDNAVVRAGGDLRVRSEIVHSEVYVGGAVEAPQATILGGFVAARGRVEVGTLGSRDGAGTWIMVGIAPGDVERARALAAERAALCDELERLEARGGPALTDPARRKALVGAARAYIRSLTRKRDQLLARRDGLDRDQAALVSDPTAAVQVLRQRHAGVTAQIGAGPPQALAPCAGRHELVARSPDEPVSAEGGA